MNRIVVFVGLILCVLSLKGQQKANYKLAERFGKYDIVGVSENSMAIRPEFINNSDRFWYYFSDRK